MSWSDPIIITGLFVIISAIIGGAVGSFAIYWLTHRPEVVAQKTKLEAKEKLKIETITEGIIAAANFQHVAHAYQINIKTLIDIVIIIYRGQKIQESPVIYGLDEVARKLNQIEDTKDVNRILAIAANQSKKIGENLFNNTTELLNTFNVYFAIYGENKEMKKMAYKVIDIHKELGSTFFIEENLSAEAKIDAIKMKKKMHDDINGEVKDSECGKRINDLVDDIIEAYVRELEDEPVKLSWRKKLKKN